MRTYPSAWVNRLLIALCLLAVGVHGQPGASSIIRGRVSNQQTGAYLQGARVEVTGTDLVTFTESDGTFQLTGAPAGDVSLTVTYTGLDPKNVQLGGAQSRENLEIELTSQVYTLEAFKVSELIEGNAAAITQQRVAMNVKNVAATDAFGSLRDGNVAELLVLMPGVVGEMVGNDIRTVQIRGFNANLGSVTVDGSKLANAESGGMERNFEFDGLTADHIESVEVIKAPTPDMGADSIGGTINMKSKSAFNFSGGRRITASAGVAFESKRDTFNPGGNLNYSEVFGPKRNLGVSFNIGYSIHNVPRDGSQITYPTNTNQPNFMQLVRLFDQLNRRVRFGGGLRFDYKLNERTTFHTNTIFTATNEQHGKYPARRLVVQSNAASVAPGFTDDRVEYRPTANTVATLELTQLPKRHEATQWGAGMKHRFNAWTFDADATISRDLQKYDAEEHKLGAMNATLNNIGLVLDRTGRDRSFPTITQISGRDIYDLANYTAAPLNQRVWVGEDRVQNARANLNRAFATRYPFSVKIGARYDNQTRRNYRADRQYAYVGPDGVANSGDESLLPFEDDHHYELAEGRYPAPTYFNLRAMGEALHDHPTWFQENPVTYATSRLQNDKRIRESVTAGYVMGTLQLGRLRALGGVRYELTEIEGTSNQRRLTPEETARRAAFVGPVTPAESVRRLEAEWSTRVKRSSDYDNFFPGLHLKYDFARGLVLRASYTTSIGRPNFASIVPTLDVNDVSQVIIANNIGLQPQFGKSINAGVEYYFDPAGVVSINGFQTDIEDFSFNSSEIVGGGSDNGFGGEYSGYELRTQANGGNGVIKGIEFNYNQQLTFLPDVLKGFSVFANYTYLKTSGNYEGSADNPVTELVGFVPKSGNFGIAFTRFGLDVRIKSTYKGKWLTAYNTIPGAVRWTHDRSNVDLNILYRINRRYSVYFDWANIFNEAEAIDYQYREELVRTNNPTGARFNAGVRLKL
jgi:TonB-dependent receptor